MKFEYQKNVCVSVFLALDWWNLSFLWILFLRLHSVLPLMSQLCKYGLWHNWNSSYTFSLFVSVWNSLYIAVCRASVRKALKCGSLIFVVFYNMEVDYVMINLPQARTFFAQIDFSDCKQKFHFPHIWNTESSTDYLLHWNNIQYAMASAILSSVFLSNLGFYLSYSHYVPSFFHKFLPLYFPICVVLFWCPILNSATLVYNLY